MILALDLAGRSGWAIEHGNGDCRYLRYGTINLVRGEIGGRRSPIPMIRLFKRLYRLLDRYRHIDKVILEETFGRGHAKYRLDSLQNCVILWCVIHDFRWQRVSPTEWKKHCVGKGTATKQEYHTAAIEKWPELKIRTDDEAAALWLLHYEKTAGK